MRTGVQPCGCWFNKYGQLIMVVNQCPEHSKQAEDEYRRCYQSRIEKDRTLSAEGNELDESELKAK